jgi:SAM-dependent methyltransferase
MAWPASRAGPAPSTGAGRAAASRPVRSARAIGQDLPVTSDHAAGQTAADGSPAAGEARRAFPDWRFAPNIGHSPDTYEIENRALDRGGHVLDAMRRLAPWAGRTLVDLGCGTGFWLPGYAAEAARVIGIEPDPALRARAVARTAGVRGVEVAAGSAEHLGLPAASVDVVHARFAYFFPPGGDAGLTEALRAVRPGGALVVVDNDYRWGEFATLLAASSPEGTREKAAATDAWWRERGAIRREVHSGWTFSNRADLDAVLQIEFPAHVADTWLARHPAATSISYGYVLFAVLT